MSLENVKMIEVPSSQISEIGYDDSDNSLYVKFPNGNTYKYNNVNKEVYNAALSAPSIGSYFSRNIKNTYSYIKL